MSIYESHGVHPDCDHKTLIRVPDSGWWECDACEGELPIEAWWELKESQE